VTGPTAEQPQVTATVSPPTPSRSRWGGIPRHLGRARTSTLVLSLLFLSIGALWLNIRPDPLPDPAGTVVDQPVAPVVPVVPVPTTEVPTTEPAPTTAPELTPTSEVPATSLSDTPVTDTTAPRFTTTSEPPSPLPDPTITPAG
jgi:hypothetical protein